MSTQPGQDHRPLARIPTPPGEAGVASILPALAAALDGSGPAIAPIPTVSAAMSNSYVMSLLKAVRASPSDPQLESTDVAVVMATSGSTGAPRGVLLSARALTSLSAAVNGSARPQWIAALPVTSMGGMNVLVRALDADREPVVLPSIGGAHPFRIDEFRTAVTKAAAVTEDVRVALVPAQVARLLSDDVGIAALRECSSILVGGGPTRRSLRIAAADLDISLTSTYGATETAGGCVFDGKPLPGVFVTSSSGSPTEPGTLTINGPMLALGYRCDPEATSEHFTADGFVTSDLGLVSDDGTVTVVGRADDVVIINGINVSPTAIERVISDLPDVVAAAVISVGDEDAAPRLFAYVEVRDSAPGVEEAVGTAVQTALGKVAVPVIRQVPRLPHLPNGKVDRRELQAWAAKEG
ncbi:MAG: AMP-binding protein [Actinomycetes bacterium]